MNILYLNGKLQLNKQEFTNISSLSLADNNGTSSSDNASILHEQHLKSYAEQLIEAFECLDARNLSMYQIAFDYLTKCRIENRGILLIESYIEKIPLKYISELEANKLYHITYELNLHDLAFELGRNLQMRALKREQFGTALGWNIKIKDLGFGTLLAERYFMLKNLSLIHLYAKS